MGDRINYFINGIGGTQESSRDQAQSIKSKIFHGKEEVISIYNDGKSNNAANELLERLTQLVSTTPGKPSIKNEDIVIFCHSHGVKVVKDVLGNEDDWLKELEERHPSHTKETYQTILANIRDKIYVICFGGICLIPDDNAKVVFNFVNKEDKISLSFFDVSSENDCSAFLRYSTEPTIRLPAVHLRDPGIVDAVRSTQFRSDEGILSMLRSSFSLSSVASGSSSTPNLSQSELGKGHYLPDYLEKKEMIKFLQVELVINVPTLAIDADNLNATPS